MDIIVHRINKIKLLKNLDIKYGVEIDVRDSGRTLVIQQEVGFMVGGGCIRSS